MSVPVEVLVDGLLIHRNAGYALEPDGWELPTPEPRASIVEYARRHGGANDTAYLAPATVQLRGAVMGSTLAEMHTRLDTLRGRLRPGRDVELQWRRHSADVLWRMLVRLGGRFETRHVNGPIAFWGVTLTGANPLALSSDLHEASYDPTLSHRGIGVTYDLVYNLTFTGVPATASLALFNAGNMPTSPLWIITGPATNPVIEDQASGAEISTTATLAGSDTLWVDVARRTARLNGEDGTLRLDLIDEANTTWFDLQPGPNAVRLTGSGMTTGSTLLTARWRDARLPD